MIASAIKEADQDIPWKQEHLVNVCPQCFKFSDEDEDGTIWILIDGNMQHARLQRDTRWDFELFEPKLFIDYGRNKLDLAMAGNEQVNTNIPAKACVYKFNASDGWNRPEIISPTMKALDQTGVVGITCFHGVNLRFLHIHGGGEKQSHSIRLIEAVLHEVTHFAKLKLWYDVACVFESALKAYNQGWMEVVEALISWFRIYDHEYRCHVLYNLLHTANYGLMVGEDPVHLWYMIQQLICSGRTASSSPPTQKIVCFGRYCPI